MALTEIYHSPRLGDCEQRAFVLKAVGIDFAVYERDDLFGLLVPEELADTAIGHLRSYDEESRVVVLPPTPLPVHPNAWVGAVVYIAALLGVAWLAGEKYGGVDWLDTGALTHAAASSNEWWRVVTALTLHADLGHMLGNIAFGAPFGFFAAQLLGTGCAWASILIAAAFGNFLDAALMPDQQQTIGASTAVFAMLGLVAAYAWRKGSGDSRRWAHRWGPLIAGIALLGVTGAGGEHTDVLAHLSGFIAGVTLGVVHGHLRTPWLDSKPAQSIAGAMSLATVAGAWLWALSRVS
ncbi:MAG: rhomboid family intramembrane serine protease [Steroidobacteraceae bacterium]